MPNCASWDGRWSGEGRKYVIVKTFRGKKETEKAERILAAGYYHYSWPDGWGAGITVSEATSSQASKLRRESNGFCGYDWMVRTICDYGRPMADHEVQEFLQKKQVDEVVS
jgi:hypothetical protein